jgi:hypothetical protein
MNTNENIDKVPFEEVQKELAGYRLRLELVQADSDRSKPFEDVDHSAVLGYFVQCFPGFETSYGSGWENLFEPEGDEF